MEKALKDAITICKTLLRNGYDAHVINAPVQEHLLKHSKQLAVDIACEPDLETLLKLFPEARVEPDQRAIAQMEKDGVLFRFYALEVEDASHPELSLLRVILHTGRTHQIRVQFSSRAMPLVGDVKYGSRYRDCALALWSHALGFRHPATGKAMSFSAMPELVFPWNGFEYFK